MFLYDGGRASPLGPAVLKNRYPGYQYLPGLRGVSQQTVSIHLKNAGKRARINKSIPDLIYRYDQILYRSDECVAEEARKKAIADALSVA